MRTRKSKSMKTPIRRIPEVDAFAISILAQASPRQRASIYTDIVEMLGPQGRSLAAKFMQQASGHAGKRHSSRIPSNGHRTERAALVGA
jgi:hypothetical protein